MSSPKSVRVLIVDDHPDTLEWMNLLLEDRGYLVQTARTAWPPSRFAIRWKPQIVLMDSKLPDVDGTELLTRFKEAGLERRGHHDHRPRQREPGGRRHEGGRLQLHREARGHPRCCWR